MSGVATLGRVAVSGKKTEDDLYQIGEQLSFLSRALCIFTRLLLPAVATDSDASSLH